MRTLKRRRSKVKGLTPRQDLVLQFVRAYLKLYGVPPSYEVIAIGLGMSSKGNICRIVHELEGKGHLVTRRYKFLSIRVQDKDATEMGKM